MEGSSNAPTSKELLFCGGDEESKLFVADGKDRVNPKPPQISRLPPSSLLAQARAFLPVLAAANAKLEQTLAENPGSLDIENVEEGKPYVRMDLAMIGEKKEGESSESEEDSDDESESEDEQEGNGEKEADEEENNNTKSPAQRRKAIEEIGGEEEEEQDEKPMEEE